MRTNFTTEDIKNLIDYIFNGNMWASKVSNGEIAYENENSEQILLTDIDTGEQTTKDLAEYLNIKFYTWKQRLVEKDVVGYGDESPISPFDRWVESLNFSMNESYALVEKLDEEVVNSQDIDSATYMGKVTFIMQTNKVKNLDYYVTKLRNSFIGSPQDIQNSFGDIVKSYIMIGALLYDEEPFTMQLGECVIVSFNFKISYLADALTYGDTQIQISLNGDDLYDENGVIVDENGDPTTTKYLTMPITKASFQKIFTSQALPTSQRPDITGFVATALSGAQTFSFYDYNKPLTLQFNDLFWSLGATRIDGVLTVPRDVNIPVYIRVISNGHSYVYKDMIDNMEKSLTNNDFNVCSLSTKGWGKLV